MQDALPRWDAGAAAAGLTPDGLERRLGRSGRLVLLLALVLLGVGVVQLAYRLSLPTLGWHIVTEGESDIPRLDTNLVEGPSSLRPGDVLVGMGGQSLEALQTRVARFDPLLTGVQVGETIGVTVVREGERLELRALLKHWTLGAVLRALGSSLLENTLTLLGLAIALFVFAQRPQHTAAQLMLLYYVGQLLLILSRITEGTAGVAVGELASPPAYVLSVLFTHLPYVVLLAPLVLHLCLTFPEPKRFVRPWLLVLVYGLPWAMLALSVALPAFGQPSLFLFAAVYSLLGSSFFVHTFMTVREPLRRAQVRWVVLGFGVSSLMTVVWALGALGFLRGMPLTVALSVPTSLILTICLALSVLRYRLFDIDLIINRTLVYGALTASVVGLYVAVVGGVGALLGTQGNLALSLLGTGLVAVLFQPLREALQRLVNRLMYGQRDEPYTLLTRLGRQIGAVQEPEAMLPGLARTVAETLKLPYVGLFLYDEGGEGARSEAVSEVGMVGSEPATLPLALPLEHQGETFGELRFVPRSGGFNPKERELLKAIAQQASVAAFALRQTRALRRSHERLVSAREAERLRLRRELHDGLGPTLSGLNLHLAALKSLSDEPERVRAGLTEVQRELRRTAGEVRRIVYDLRPPSLDELGLKGALGQLAHSLSTPRVRVSLELPDLPPLPPATEVALYRVAQEGFSNALKHAQASQVRLALTLGEILVLTVTDDGSGFPEHYRAGVGLASMRERAEALGGRLDIHSRPHEGTTVRLEVPHSQEGTL